MEIENDLLMGMWNESKGDTLEARALDFARRVEKLNTVRVLSALQDHKTHETVHDLATVLGPMVDGHVTDKPQAFVLRFSATASPDGGIGFADIALSRWEDVFQAIAAPNRAARRQRGSRGMR